MFPKYLVIRRPAVGKHSEQNVWQGFVADIKNSNKKMHTEINTELRKV